MRKSISATSLLNRTLVYFYGTKWAWFFHWKPAFGRRGNFINKNQYENQKGNPTPPVLFYLHENCIHVGGERHRWSMKCIDLLRKFRFSVQNSTFSVRCSPRGFFWKAYGKFSWSIQNSMVEKWIFCAENRISDVIFVHFSLVVELDILTEVLWCVYLLLCRCPYCTRRKWPVK